MTLIKDLISIPERVHQGDFVLKLSEGVNDAQATLRDYVITPQLVECFGNALGFIKQAVQANSSKAAYLHGSFGAGKSHFMAVLSLLLEGNPLARSQSELADVVAANSWVNGKRFLLVPYHMVGALDMESAVLGGYAEYVRKRHPQAPVPGFYLAEGLFEDAAALRAQIGDAAFFDKLNQAPQSELSDDDSRHDNSSGWGNMEGGWDAASYALAIAQAPHGDDRAKLVGALISQFFTAYRSLANQGEAYVSLDAGLGIMTRHAQSLGYDAVMLFLDELVLWLASHAANPGFVAREGTKLVKLVEATEAERPIPLISFVARQRDLRDLVGENLSGAAHSQFSDVVRHWEARFHRIMLEDRNLPAIAEKRVLRPINEAAKQTLAAAFENILRVKRDVLDTLLTSTADREMFQKVYPFSPALVQTLIAVSAALQRERTALKLMLQLLVDRRDDLQLEQLIPVGDLYDAISDGDEPFSTDMRIHFDNAKRLYNKRLLPMLERQHKISAEDIATGRADALLVKNLRNDARILKTLLLAALVPEVEALKALTGPRLAALNYGSFKSPISGREWQDILRKCRDWATEIAEIKLSEDNNSINTLVSIQITGLDIEPIVRAAESLDNAGNRRKLLREMLMSALQLPDTGQIFGTPYEFVWRNTQRQIELTIDNVRDLTFERFQSTPGMWKVVLDFPFDDHGGQNDHCAALVEHKARAGGALAHTLVWLASFFSQKALNDLGRLVVLEHILSGERFDTYATHLTQVDKVHARALARNQLEQLRIKLRSQIEVAYGISSEPRDAVEQALAPEQQFQSLDPTLNPRPPIGADFKEAFEGMLGQLLTHQFPAHPQFEIEVRSAQVKKIWPEVLRAIEAQDHRTQVLDNALRKVLRAILLPLQLAKVSETHLILDDFWRVHFMQCHARDGQAVITVRQMRQWIDQPRSMGLPLELQNLLIHYFAALSNRRFLLRGGPFAASLENLPDELELQEQALPDAQDFALAVARASALFGLTPQKSLNVNSVGSLIDDVKQVVKERREGVMNLVPELRKLSAEFVTPQSSRDSRERSADTANALLASLAQANGSELVSLLAHSHAEVPDATLAKCIVSATAVRAVLQLTSWNIFRGLRNIQDGRQAAAAQLLKSLDEALAYDELVIELKPRLDKLQGEAVALLAEPIPTSTPSSAPTAAPEPAAASALVPVSASASAPSMEPLPLADFDETLEMLEQETLEGISSAKARPLLEALQRKLAQDENLQLTISWRLSRTTKRGSAE